MVPSLCSALLTPMRAGRGNGGLVAGDFGGGAPDFVGVLPCAAGVVGAEAEEPLPRFCFPSLMLILAVYFSLLFSLPLLTVFLIEKKKKKTNSTNAIFFFFLPASNG